MTSAPKYASRPPQKLPATTWPTSSTCRQPLGEGGGGGVRVVHHHVWRLQFSLSIPVNAAHAWSWPVHAERRRVAGMMRSTGALHNRACMHGIWNHSHRHFSGNQLALIPTRGPLAGGSGAAPCGCCSSRRAAVVLNAHFPLLDVRILHRLSTHRAGDRECPSRACRSRRGAPAASIAGNRLTALAILCRSPKYSDCNALEPFPLLGSVLRCWATAPTCFRGCRHMLVI